MVMVMVRMVMVVSAHGVDSSCTLGREKEEIRQQTGG
jgi:hypothetical protein